MTEPGGNDALALSRAIAGDASDRTYVELIGADRAKFLHNLCSNDILRLSPGQGCEALLLNAKGRVVGHTFVYASEESLILDSSPGQGEKLVAHLDRYIIREKVEVRDRTAEMAQFVVGGSGAGSVLEKLGGVAPGELLAHAPGTLAGQGVFLRRSGLIGPECCSVVCRREQRDAVLLAIQEAGAATCDATAIEAARIEAGVPLYGIDITEDNLPQEVDRNDRAISFTKGCYLGQETVARIDALGHVNRTLVGLRFSGEQAPPAGCELKSGESVVGRVTSLAFSRRFSATVALGYVKQGQNQPGMRLTSEAGEAMVTALPMNP